MLYWFTLDLNRLSSRTIQLLSENKSELLDEGACEPLKHKSHPLGHLW